MCVRLKAPIVLAHGLFGFRQIALGPVTLTTYFRGIPEWLEAAGNRVLVTQVPAIAGLSRRAKLLGAQIEAAFPGERVHIIGHSSGGLDARALLTDRAWSRRTVSLTTIATPHLGTGVADFAKIRFGRIYRQLNVVGIDHLGLIDITRRAARAFHRRVGLPPGVACFSMAGDPSASDICWPLRRLHSALLELEGPNDGVVSVESAIAFGTVLPSHPLDHLRQMNWLVPDNAPSDLPALSMYSDVITNLARVEADTPMPEAFVTA